MTRLEAHWKLSTAHRLRNTDLDHAFFAQLLTPFVGTVITKPETSFLYHRDVIYGRLFNDMM